MTPCGSNVYTNPNMEIISPSRNVLNLGIYMSGDCIFNYHISSLSKKCANLSGWILRTFYTRDCITVRLRLSVMVAISDQTYNSTREDTAVAPNDTAYKRWSCHSGFKLLCKLCRTSPPPAMGARFTVFWACGPAGWLALLLTKAGDVETNPGPTTLNKKVWICDICHKQKYMSESRYP